MGSKHLTARHDRIRERVWQAHSLLHSEDTDGAHLMLHRALGLPDDEGVEPTVGRVPAARIAEFDQAFRDLCRTHNVGAAYVLDDDGRALTGGVASICAALVDKFNTTTRESA